ncbi:MAG TPA: type II toxin-antitoxin system VapC family toxin [Rickettsia endosymbiont of Omalisus fontisbellaquei]|jgi:PIN domain nuclease of toxin-antitoxin system|nr:type II toxin-antitoxin system VapC family toxin [Rickettsia endosymbiont of Omalisus fontisbellaquei]
MSKIIFDASALIALFAKEDGYQLIKKHMRDGVISSVNIAEVYKYCIEKQGLTEETAKILIKLSDIKIIDFCPEQALISANIINKTKIYGLSLGDRACIALAIFKNYPILTCDKVWQKLDLGIKFIMAR